jgi:hypothetical protein
MHRSSESVAAIATALAKAQTELSNPEKAMVGTVNNRSTPSPTETVIFLALVVANVTACLLYGYAPFDVLSVVGPLLCLAAFVQRTARLQKTSSRRTG